MKIENELLKEIKLLRKEVEDVSETVKYGDFDTIYTSVLVLTLSILVAIFITKGLSGLEGFYGAVVIFLGTMLGLSLIFQILSLFFSRSLFKYLSVISVLLSLTAIVINLNTQYSGGWPILLLIYLATLILAILIGLYFEKSKAVDRK